MFKRSNLKEVFISHKEEETEDLDVRTPQKLTKQLRSKKYYFGSLYEN
jgi:hypothetical protein